MSWSESEIETILEQMRAGAGVMTGGSRCHTSYFFRAGAWLSESFDEGHTQESASSEAEIRALIEREPKLFRGVLRAPRWARFSAAFMADEPDRAHARELLRHAGEYGGDEDTQLILDAVLAWPETPLSAELVERIRTTLAGFTAYHVFMAAAQWERTAAVGHKGIAFVERLVEMVGETRGSHHLRASFHELAGELLAAERELELELARDFGPDEEWRREVYEASLDRIRRLEGQPPPG